MFANTITVTINALAKTLTRINQDNYCSEYFLREADGEYRLTIRNSSFVDKKRIGAGATERHTLQLVHTLNPVAPSTVSKVRKTYVVIENDVADGTVAPLNHAKGTLAFFTDANIGMLLNNES